MVEDGFDSSHIPSPRAAVGANGSGHEVGPVGVLRMLASDFASRINFAKNAGLTFSGARDLYNALGYSRTLQPRDYRDRYKRGDIAARIVEAFPDATWSGGAEIVEDEDPSVSTALEEEFGALQERLQVWSMIHRTDILAGLGPFAVLLIGASGRLEDELPRMGSQEDVLYLQPFGPDEAVIDTYELNAESPRFGLPLVYHVTRRTTGTRTSGTLSFDRRVHWTRLLHVADGLLDDLVNGTPRLEKIWNRLDDLDKVVGGGSEAFWLRVNQGQHWDVDPNVKIEQTQIDKLKEEAEEFAHQIRRTIATRGMKVTQMGSDVSPFNNQVMSLISLISGATKIPQRILLGSERGELASTQDRENWNDRVAARRGGFGTPVVRAFVGRLMDYGALPEAESYEVRWPEIKALTMQEQAAVASAWAGLSSAAGGPVVLPEEIRDRVLGLEKLDPDQLAEMDAKEQQRKDEEQAKIDALKPDKGKVVDEEQAKIDALKPDKGKVVEVVEEDKDK